MFINLLLSMNVFLKSTIRSAYLRNPVDPIGRRYRARVCLERRIELTPLGRRVIAEQPQYLGDVLASLGLAVGVARRVQERDHRRLGDLNRPRPGRSRLGRSRLHEHLTQVVAPRAPQSWLRIVQVDRERVQVVGVVVFAAQLQEVRFQRYELSHVFYCFLSSSSFLTQQMDIT